jgi:hypothetical protein
MDARRPGALIAAEGPSRPDGAQAFWSAQDRAANLATGPVRRGQPSSAARIRSWNSASGMRAASAGLSLIVPLPEANSG